MSPQSHAFLWHRSSWCGSRVCHARACLGGLGVGSLAPDLGSLYSDTLSVRDVARSTPHRLAYCDSPNGRWFGSPVGQYSSLVLRSSIPGLLRPSPYRLDSAEPCALAETHPLGHPPAFPHPDERHAYFVDLFIWYA